MFQCFSMECSLKPFKQTDDAYVRSVARRIFAHWKPLLKHVPVVSILLWVGDGSEILDYDRDDSVELEWGRYAGSANTRVTTWYKDRDPRREGLHSLRHAAPHHRHPQRRRKGGAGRGPHHPRRRDL